MCWKRFCIAVFAAMCLVSALPNESQAAFISWTNPNGTVGNLTWSGGGSEGGIWGNPDTAHFPPFAFNPGNGMAFSVNNNSGNSTTLDSPMQVYLSVPVGFEITNISLAEDGLYSITGGGFVKDSAEIRVQNLDVLGPPVVAFNTLFTTNVSGSAPWNGTLNALLPGNWRNVMLIIDNNLQAGSTTGGAAFIDKKSIQVSISIEAVAPEPVALATLLCGAPLLLRRRQR